MTARQLFEDSNLHKLFARLAGTATRPAAPDQAAAPVRVS
jgi:hypothetical protein